MIPYGYKINFINFKFDKFKILINNTLCESKNIKISEILVNNIKQNFKYENILKFDKTNLDNVSDEFELYVYIINSNDLSKYFKSDQFKILGYTLFDIEKIFKTDYGIYIPTASCGYILLNYSLLKNNMNELDNIIKHELTHIYTNPENNEWIDLLPEKYDESNQLIKDNLNKLYILFLKFGLNYEDMYCLTSAKEFESYCTSIEHYKNELDKNIIKNDIFKILYNDFLSTIKPNLQRLYIFILLNKVFDISNKRFKYILENLE